MCKVWNLVKKRSFFSFRCVPRFFIKFKCTSKRLFRSVCYSICSSTLLLRYTALYLDRFILLSNILGHSMQYKIDHVHSQIDHRLHTHTPIFIPMINTFSRKIMTTEQKCQAHNQTAKTFE